MPDILKLHDDLDSLCRKRGIRFNGVQLFDHMKKMETCVIIGNSSRHGVCFVVSELSALDALKQVDDIIAMERDYVFPRWGVLPSHKQTGRPLERSRYMTWLLRDVPFTGRTTEYVVGLEKDVSSVYQIAH